MERQDDICSIVPCNANTVLANLRHRFLNNSIYVSKSFFRNFNVFYFIIIFISERNQLHNLKIYYSRHLHLINWLQSIQWTRFPVCMHLMWWKNTVAYTVMVYHRMSLESVRTICQFVNISLNMYSWALSISLLVINWLRSILIRI